ncbi:MAG: two-component system LytT family response regulator [Arenicella sp.]|jgi:two-component system LytT family response regulator
MPGQSVFDSLDHLDYIPQVIFTKADSEYAHRAFDYNPVDYLLKPISLERPTSAINKLSVKQDLVIQEPFDMSSKIFIKNGDDCHLVSLRDMHYLESSKNLQSYFLMAINHLYKRV